MATEVQQPPVETPGNGGSGMVITRRGNEVIEPPAPETPETPETPAPETPAAEVPETPETPETPEVPETPETPAPETPETPVAEEEEVDFFGDYSSGQTGGVIKTPDDVYNIVKERNELKRQLAEKPKIEFPNEQARLLYEMSIKFPGQELAAARSTLHVLSLDLSKLSDKDKQFEAFALKYKHLPREEARKYFDGKYEKSYGNGILDEDVTAQFDHMNQTQEAVELIKKVQEDFSKLPPSKPADEPTPQQLSPEQLAVIKEDVSKALNQFGGVKYELFKGDSNSIVSVPLEQADLQKLEEYMVNPGVMLNDIIQECTVNGEFDNNALAVVMFEFKNRDRIKEQAFKQGVKYGELKIIKERKNTSTPKPPETPAPVVNKPKNLAEAMIAANIGKKKVA